MRALVTLLICLAITFAAFPNVGNFLMMGSGAKIERSKDGFLAITKDESYFELNIGNGVNLSDYRVIQMRSPHEAVKQLGVVAELAVVPSAAYDEFEEIVNAGSCAASFLNENALTLLLVPDGDQTRKILSAVRYRAGDPVTLKGRDLEVAYAEIDGHELENYVIGNASLIMIESLV